MARRMEGQQAFDPVLPNGVPLNEGVTALIKNLRRGRELEALFWAQQIESNFHKYLWRRLLIFASEDVNIANPDAVVQVRALADNYAQVKAESRNPVVDRSILTMAVMVLARSQKSRECDDLLNVIEHLKGWGWSPPPRDEVFDLHTHEGKRRWPRQARLRHWLEAASFEVDRVGPRDWHLWLLKWAAQRGIYEVTWVKEVADLWEREGWLLYGPDGLPEARFAWEEVVPEFAGLAPARPALTDDGWLSDAPWVWHCSECTASMEECMGGLPRCCETCQHDPPDMSVDPGVK